MKMPLAWAPMFRCCPRWGTQHEHGVHPDARKPPPLWLTLVLVVMHVLPLLLFGAALVEQSPDLDLASPRVVSTLALGAVGVAVLVKTLVLDHICCSAGQEVERRLIESWSPALEKEFRGWMHSRVRRLQAAMIVTWAAWWNLAKPMNNLLPDVTPTIGDRAYSVLVPNLLVCSVGARSLLRMRASSGDIDWMERVLAWLSWLKTASTPSKDTAPSGASRGSGRSTYAPQSVG